MVIEPATEKDEARIYEMGMRFMATRPNGMTVDADPMRMHAAINLCLTTGVVLLSKVPGFASGDQEGNLHVNPWIVTGMLAIYVLPHPLTGEMTAEELAWWVEPEHRDTKSGYNLLRFAEGWATAAGVSCLKMVAPAHSRISSFYESLGYQAVETVYVKRF